MKCIDVIMNSITMWEDQFVYYTMLATVRYKSYSHYIMPDWVLTDPIGFGVEPVSAVEKPGAQ